MNGIKVLVGVINPGYLVEMIFLLNNGGKKEYVGSSGDSLGYLLLLPCPVRMTKGTDGSGMKLWSLLQKNR